MDEMLQASSHLESERRMFEKRSLNLYASTSYPPLGARLEVISPETTAMVVVVPSRREMSKKDDEAHSSAVANDSEEFVSFNSAVGSDFDFSATFSEVEGAPWSPPPMSSAEELFYNGQIRPLAQYPPAQLDQSKPPLSRSDDGYFDFRSSANYASPSPPQSPPDSPRQAQRKQRYRCPIQTNTPALEEWKKSNEDRRKKSGVNSRRMAAGSRRSRSHSPLRVFHMDDQAEQSGGGDFCRSRISDGGGKKERKTLKQLLDAGENGELQEFARKEEKLSTTAENSSDERRAKPKKTSNPPSPSLERHYTSQRFHAQQMKRKTFLPYRHGLLGCLGFTSRHYRSVSGMNSFHV